MSKTVTSKEQILEVSCRIVAKRGISAVNMRTVASECGIALGSLYNYFASKSELLSSTIEAVWKDVFQEEESGEDYDNFIEYLRALIDRIESSKQRYPKFFSMHALGFASEEKPEGRKMMTQYFQKVKKQMLYLLENDKKIRSRIFTERFTAENFVDYVFKLLLSVLVEDQEKEETFLEFVKNYLYTEIRNK